MKSEDVSRSSLSFIPRLTLPHLYSDHLRKIQGENARYPEEGNCGDTVDYWIVSFSTSSSMTCQPNVVRLD